MSKALPKPTLKGRYFKRRAGKPGYGIDDYYTIIELGAAGVISAAIGILITAYTASGRPEAAAAGLLVGPAVGFLILIIAAALYWSSRLGKVREMRNMLSTIPWGGGEFVVDIGCGRGLGMVTASKRLVTGLAVGVDTWKGNRLSGNTPASIWVNGKKEGVEDRLTAVMAVPTSLPFSDSSVDVVVSGMAIRNIVSKADRPALFAEMNRVLKEGGRVAILDAGNGGLYSNLFKRAGLHDVEVHRLRFTSFPPFHVVLARKPYGQ
jgi:SAM-dependent methyltransferase